MACGGEGDRVHVVVWVGMMEKFRGGGSGAASASVAGVRQAGGKVWHLVARKFVDRTGLLGALPTTSREFCCVLSLWPLPRIDPVFFRPLPLFRHSLIQPPSTTSV
ncbi:hypothetical protein DWU95_12850 [Burkholderia contaminans]|nr:hypothetical protein DWU95_12850 [Burkholderia contaminans]